MADRTINGAKARFWRDGNGWACRVPPAGDGLDAIFAKIDGPNWWRSRGLIGRGATKAEALRDLQSWERAAEFVADIY